MKTNSSVIPDLIRDPVFSCPWIPDQVRDDIWCVVSLLKYCDGQEVKLADMVKLGQDDGGVVVCSIDADEYSDEHPKSQWGYLKKGVMIEFPMWGLIHYKTPESDLQLIARAQPKKAD